MLDENEASIADDQEEDFEPVRLDEILQRIRAKTSMFDADESSYITSSLETTVDLSSNGDKPLVPVIRVTMSDDESVDEEEPTTSSEAVRPRSPVTVQEWVESLPFPPLPPPPPPVTARQFRTNRRNYKTPTSNGVAKDDIGYEI